MGTELPVGTDASASQTPYVVSPEDLEINEGTYDWSVRLFTLFRKLLRINVNLRGGDALVQQGEIFLFNHFSRFETFIPQYLIYQACGAYSRAVASAEFFRPGDPLTAYLSRVGAVPNDMEGLLPYLAAEILRGRKLVIFPEGGMVKDRRVLDDDGEYRIYSRTAEDRRKHHTGAAVLALALEAFRADVRRARDRREHPRIEKWAEGLGLTPDGLLTACMRPTTVVPANITFYPIRVGENLLSKGAEMLGAGLSPRATEELLVEGNLLFKDTDMDIQLGAPLFPSERWRRWEHALIGTLSRRGRLSHLEDFFDLGGQSPVLPQLLSRRMRRKVARLRDGYMHEMYRAVTVNLSHLASSTIQRYVASGRSEIDNATLYRCLYMTIKQLQSTSVHLHRSLLDPAHYGGLLRQDCAGLEQFLHAKTTMELLEPTEQGFKLTAKLFEEHHFDEIRLENLIAVYANEVAPIKEVENAVTQALDRVEQWGGSDAAQALADDELRRFEGDKRAYCAPAHRAIRDAETATEDASPFLLLPQSTADSGLGVLVVHGFLASPAEMRGFAERAAEAGFPAYGVRLAGHGTSPWDLRDQPFEAWLAAVERGYRIVAQCCERVCVVGFSTGGALALRFAAERPAGLAGVAAVAAPLKFRNRSMVFVPLVHGVNKLVRWTSSSEGVMPFRVNESENPHINYRNIPIRGLHELRRLTEELKERLGDIDTRVLIMQGTDDPVVDPESASLLAQELDPSQTWVKMVPADHHGIVYRDTEQTQQRLVDFLRERRGTGRP